MKRSLLAAALLAATATTALAASADNSVTLRNAGYWTSWYDPSNSEGQPMCGVRSTINYNSGARGSFMVKYAPGGGLFVHVFKSSWSIPKGTEIPIALQFDRGEPLTAVGAGGTPDGGGGFIAFTVNVDFSKSFLDLFASSSTMTLGFREGSERPWAISMNGSREVANSFAKCIVALSQTPGSTQPFGKGSTQPFGSAPTKPSQPFGAQPAPKSQQPHDDGGI